MRFTFCAVVSRCAAVSLAPLLQKKVPSCLMPYVNGSHQQKRCGVLLSSYNDHLVCLKVSNISYTLPHLQLGKTVRTMLALHGFGVRVRVGVGGWIQS